jgi:hypothetical protein
MPNTTTPFSYISAFANAAFCILSMSEFHHTQRVVKKQRHQNAKSFFYFSVTFICVRAYLGNLEDLAVGLLDLLELRHEVPEAAAGHNGVGGKELHAEDLGLSLKLGGHVATNDQVLVHGYLQKGETICT